MPPWPSSRTSRYGPIRAPTWFRSVLLGDQTQGIGADGTFQEVWIVLIKSQQRQRFPAEFFVVARLFEKGRALARRARERFVEESL